MASLYSDVDQSCLMNSLIWSDNTDHISDQRGIGATAMQQLAYELSVFNLNQQQQRRQKDEQQQFFDAGPVSSSIAFPVTDDEDESQLGLLARRRSQNTTECVPVPSSEHVAEIVGRQGCKIKALRAKTNTYIKTPVRGDEPVFVVTGRRDDVEAAKSEILSAADHFTQIRASRRHSQGGIPAPGHVTAYVRVPYKVVGLVVGPKGATIKRVQQQTHTYIITPSREKDPVFEVTGLPENVEAARKEIETHIANRTGVYPATTVGAPQPRSLEDDVKLTDSPTSTPDPTPTAGIFAMDSRRDSVGSLAGRPCFPAFARASSFSACTPYPLLTANLEQRRASADAFFYGNAYNGGNAGSTNGPQTLSAWPGASGLASITNSTSSSIGMGNSNKIWTVARSNFAYSYSGSDQDEGVWSVGGESPNSLNAEPLASSCLGSIWSELVGV